MVPRISGGANSPMYTGPAAANALDLLVKLLADDKSEKD